MANAAGPQGAGYGAKDLHPPIRPPPFCFTTQASLMPSRCLALPSFLSRLSREQTIPRLRWGTGPIGSGPEGGSGSSGALILARRLLERWPSWIPMARSSWERSRLR